MIGLVAAMALLCARNMSNLVATSCMLCGLSSGRLASMLAMSWAISGGVDRWIFEARGGISEA
jgi:hypothetical protein